MKNNKKNNKSVVQVRKTDPLVRIYFALFWFVIFTFIPILVIYLVPPLNQFVTIHRNIAMIVLLLTITSGITLIALFPLGIILYGIWGIVNKESAYHTLKTFYVPPVRVSGYQAVILGWFFLFIGIILLWAEIGILTGLFCNAQSICSSLPKFIKFL
jgi:hypothetical protein